MHIALILSSFLNSTGRKTPPSMAAKTFYSCLVNLFLLLHAGCFFFPTRPAPTRARPKPKSLWSFLSRLFSAKRPSHHSIFRTGSEPEPPSGDPHSPLRSDIFPCPACGEIFPRANLLSHHQSTRHAVSVLHDADPSTNVVRIIFTSGWIDRAPRIHRILKVHNSSKTLARFEEYREAVMARAASNGAVWGRSERCLVDGNEMLRFYCTTFVCELGRNGNVGLCGLQYCSVCGIIRAGFSAKLDGIATLADSWRAHVAVSDDVEADFAFLSVKRAMLVCRVVAGRVGCDQGVVEKGDPGFDSVVSSGGFIGSWAAEGGERSDGEEELLVFNPRAVLPCFVIVYSV